MTFNINGLKHRPTHTGAVRFVCFVRWIEPLCSLTAQKRKGSSDKVNKERKLCSLTLSRVGAAESSLRRSDNSLCSLPLTDNMLLKSNQMHSWMNLPPSSLCTVVWKAITEPFLFFAGWNTEAEGANYTESRGLISEQVCDEKCAAEHWNSATVVLRLQPVGYWFTENICLCSDQRFWS